MLRFNSTNTVEFSELPGNHVLAMPAAHLAPGIYVLRLMQSGSERRARCAVVR